MFDGYATKNFRQTSRTMIADRTLFVVQTPGMRSSSKWKPMINASRKMEINIDVEVKRFHSKIYLD